MQFQFQANAQGIYMNDALGFGLKLMLSTPGAADPMNTAPCLLSPWAHPEEGRDDRELMDDRKLRDD